MDSLANLFSAIRNGYSVQKSKIIQPNSKQSRNVLNIFIKQGWINSYKITVDDRLEIYLKYKNNKSVIKEIKRLSKPGRRIYIKNRDLFRKKTGFYIISTSKGILIDLQAKQFNLGGELICQIF